jgi:arabinogalactan oligomer / maltooligosaccharide transport system substrate-binding protein
LLDSSRVRASHNARVSAGCHRLRGWRGARRRRRSPRRSLLAACCLAAAALSCGAGSDRPAELAVGTTWVGHGAETLNQELTRIAHRLGPVTIDLRPFNTTALADYLLRSQPVREEGSLDFVVVPNDWLGQLFERDLICELPVSRVDALQQRLVRQALLAVSDHDQVLAYPVSAEVLALVYDPDRFPSPPRTMDELLATPLPPGVLPFALNVLSPNHLAPLVTSFQGSLLDRDGNFVWRDDALLAVLGRLDRLWRLPGAWNACRANDTESLQLQLFSEGKLASFVAGPWLLEALEATGRPFAVMPILPFADSPSPARALVGYQCVAVLRDSRWVDLALEVGAHFLDADVNEAINHSTRRLPVLLSSYPMTSSGTVGFLRALEGGQAFQPSANWSEGFQRVGERLQRLRSQATPPTLASLQARLAGGRP